MSYMPYTASTSAMAPPGRLTIPISTGVSLSERFKRLRPPAQMTLDQGGFGYGIPAVRSQNMSLTRGGNGGLPPVHPSISAKNRALAISLAKGAQIQALRLKRRSVIMGARGGSGRGRAIPIAARLGLVGGITRVRGQLRVGARGRGVGVRRGISQGIARNGGLNFVQNTTSTIGSRLGVRTLTRGGQRGRGVGRFQRGSGISPMNRSASVNTRGGRGGGGQVQVKSKEDLDKELDSYMSKSKNRQKTDLDKELDDYMSAARAQAQALSSTTALTGSTDAEGDVAMEAVN